MKQGPHDYWSQLRFIGHLNGENYYAFRYKFCVMGGFKGKQVIGGKNLEHLAEIMAPVSFTATKEEWTDLPPKMYTTRRYQLTPVLQQHFDTMLQDFVAYISDENTVSVDIAITKYMKLAQIMAGFIYDEQGETHMLVPNSKNPRLNLLQNVIEDEITGKVCVAFTHKPSYTMLMERLSGYNPAYIRGGMSGNEIDAQKDKFNNDPKCRVMLLQIRASKYGHTLLGGAGLDRCSTMVFFENTYSLDDRSQIEDRIHRHGQDADSVLYVDFVGTDIDTRIIEALQRKSNLFAAIQQAVKEVSVTSSGAGNRAAYRSPALS
jgi:hypothetical protein